MVSVYFLFNSGPPAHRRTAARRAGLGSRPPDCGFSSVREVWRLNRSGKRSKTHGIGPFPFYPGSRHPGARSQPTSAPPGRAIRALDLGLVGFLFLRARKTRNWPHFGLRGCPIGSGCFLLEGTHPWAAFGATRPAMRALLRPLDLAIADFELFGDPVWLNRCSKTPFGGVGSAISFLSWV